MCTRGRGPLAPLCKSPRRRPGQHSNAVSHGPTIQSYDRQWMIPANLDAIDTPLGKGSAGSELARPLANDNAQFVGLLLQLLHPFHLHGHVTTDLRDLAFNSVRQFDRFATSPSRGPYDLGLGHDSPTAYPDSVARSPDVPFRTERHSPVVSFLSSARGGRRLPHRVSLSAKGGGADDPRVHWFTAFLTFLPIRTAAIKVTIHHSTEAVSPSSLEGTVQCRPHTGAGP